MNFKKSKIRSLVLLALAAVAFCGLIWFANKDRPVYRSSNMAGTDYEVGRVLRVVEDHKTVDEEMDGIWRGSMTLEVEILTGRYKGDTAIVENYFSSLYNVRVAEGDKVSIRIDTTGEDEYQVSVYNYYRVPQMIGCIVAFVVSILAIRFLMDYVKKHTFTVFGWYRIALGILVLGIWAVQTFVLA